MDLGEENGGLYLVKPFTTTSHDPALQQQQNQSTSCLSISELWHCRLGHPSSQHMIHIQGLPCKTPTNICSICPQAKQQRASFPLSASRANAAFELLHVDIWGPHRVPSYDGYRLFLSIVDDYTRAT